MKKFARLFVIALLLLIVFCFLVPAVSAEEFIANQTNVSLSAKIPISEPVAALSVQTNGSFSGGAADSPVLLLNPDTEGIGSEIHRNDTSYRFGRPANIFSPNPSGGVLPVANFVGTPTSGIAPHTVSFTDISSNSPTGWAWYFGDENYTAPWTRVTASAGWTGRGEHSSVAMPDGSIVLLGGITDISPFIMNDTWRSTDNGATWTRVTASAGWLARCGHTSVVMPDGSIVLMGGYSGGGGVKNDTWRSTDNGATWTRVNASAGWTGRQGHSSVAMPDGSIVLMGGFDSGFKNDVWRSTDKGATWTQVNASAGWTPRDAHSSVAMPDGSIVLMGGAVSGGTFKNDVWRSTNNGTTWTQVNASAGWSTGYSHSSVAMLDGSIVLMGGYGGGYKNGTWRSTDKGASWTQVNISSGWSARNDHTSVVMPDGSIVLMGGRDSGYNYMNDTWRFMPVGSSAQNPSHTYTTPGIYQVALQVYNAGGYNSTRRTGYITVIGAPIPHFTANVTAGAAPLTVQFYDNSIGIPTSWNWSFGDGYFSVLQNPAHTYTYVGTYTVSLNTTNALGSNTATRTNYIIISVIRPIPDFSANVTLGTAPLSVSFTDLSLKNPIGWAWYFGDENFTVPWTLVNASAGWTARWSHSSVAMPDGSIVLLGGADTDGYKNDVWQSTDNGAMWTQVNASAGWTARYFHSSVVMPDGSIVLLGGADTDGYKNDVWRSTDNGTTWRRVNASAGWTARYGHHSVAMRDGSIVLTGGWDGKNPRKNDVWQFISVGSSAKNPSHVYTKPGRYPVALQSYNTEGYNSTRKTGYIRVIVGPDLIGEIVDTPQFVKKNADNSIHYNITFAIRNIGDADVINPFTIHFKAPGMPGMISNVTFGNDIPANHTLTMEFQMNVIPTETETTITLYSQGSTKLITVITGGNISVGVHEISMGIDVDNDIQELNETNNYVNTTTYVLPFSAPKQLQVSSASGNSGVILYVSANGTSNFSGANIQLTWDPAVMNVTNIQDLSGLGAFNHSPVPATTGSMVFNVSGPNSFSGVTNQQSTKLK